MKKTPTTTKPKKTPTKPITSWLNRLNVTLFIVIVVGGLIYSILILTNILQLSPSSSSSSTSQTTSTQFDQTTINNIKKLKASSDNSTAPALPSGRTNPFSE